MQACTSASLSRRPAHCACGTGHVAAASNARAAARAALRSASLATADALQRITETTPLLTPARRKGCEVAGLGVLSTQRESTASQALPHQEQQSVHMNLDLKRPSLLCLHGLLVHLAGLRRRRTISVLHTDFLRRAPIQRTDRLHRYALYMTNNTHARSRTTRQHIEAAVCRCHGACCSSLPRVVTGICPTPARFQSTSTQNITFSRASGSFHITKAFFAYHGPYDTDDDSPAGHASTAQTERAKVEHQFMLYILGFSDCTLLQDEPPPCRCSSGRVSS